MQNEIHVTLKLGLEKDLTDYEIVKLLNEMDLKVKHNYIEDVEIINIY